MISLLAACARKPYKFTATHYLLFSLSSECSTQGLLIGKGTDTMAKPVELTRF